MGQLGANAHGEVLEPGRVPGCAWTQTTRRRSVCWWSPPPALLHPAMPQPDGTLLYELLTGHPDRTAHELVFVADLTVERRAWPTDTWASLGVDPQAAAAAVVAAWRRGHLNGLQLRGLTDGEAMALERPAMTYVREQLRQRLARQIGRAYRRWLHPTSGRRPGDRFL
jgi:hypothetical protein